MTSCLLVQEFATQVQGTEDNWKVPEANQNPQTQGGTETMTSSCFFHFHGKGPELARVIRCLGAKDIPLQIQDSQEGKAVAGLPTDKH